MASSPIVVPRTMWQLTRFCAAAYCFHTYVGQTTQCQGPSMLPTLNARGDVVIIDKLSVQFTPLQRNELIVAKSPTKNGQKVCKRVIALAGDVVFPYTSNAPDANATSDPRRRRRPFKVPPGHIWIEGDNLHNSSDSRRYGSIPMALVEGRCRAKVWPLSEARVFRVSDPIVRPTPAQRQFGVIDTSGYLLDEEPESGSNYNNSGGSRSAGGKAQATTTEAHKPSTTATAATTTTTAAATATVTQAQTSVADSARPSSSASPGSQRV